MATPPKVQIKRTASPATPPTGLEPGELAVEMGSPTRLWVGVPVAQDPSGKKLLVNTEAGYSKAETDAKFVEVAGDTMTGPLVLPADPVADNQAANKHYVDLVAINSGGIEIPSGTKMMFCQAAAPTGWTRDTTHHDKALRVVGSTAGGAVGGVNSFSAVMAQTVVGNHTLTALEAPTISSSGVNNISITPPGGGTFSYLPAGNSWFGTSIYPNSGTYYTLAANAAGIMTYTGALSGNNSIGVTSNNTGAGAHNHTIAMSIQYVDVLIAGKN